MPQIRRRPKYPRIHNDGITERSILKDVTDAERIGIGCNKFYEYSKSLGVTGGLMVLWCRHGICLGFHCIPGGEGRNDVFSALLTRWRKAPKVVIYDYACALAPYCMTREPAFFKETLFLIDTFHAEGHTRCSAACFIANYAKWNNDLAKVNSSAGESGNGGLFRIRKSLLYMMQRRSIVYAKTFLSCWNRAKRRALQDSSNQVIHGRSGRRRHNH